MKLIIKFFILLCFLLSVVSCGGNSKNLKNIPYDYNAKLSGSVFCDAGDVVLFLALRPFIDDHDNYNSGWYLYEYDKITGEAEFFCKDATCLHGQNDYECASFNLQGCLELADGRVRAARLHREADANVTLEMINAGLFLASYVCELRNGKFIDVAGPFSHQSRDFTYRNGVLYAVTPDISLIRFTNEKYSKPEVIFEEFSSSNFVIIDDYFYGLNINGNYRFDVSNPVIEYMNDIYPSEKSDVWSSSFFSAYDGEHFYITMSRHGIYRTSAVGNELALVYEQKQSDLVIRGMTMDDEYLYFGKTRGVNSPQMEDYIYCLKKDLSEPPELICQFGPPQWFKYMYAPPGMDVLFFLVHDQITFGPGQTGIDRLFTVNKDGSDFKEVDLPSLY